MFYDIYSLELQIPTLIVAVVGLIVLSRYLPLWAALLLAIGKAAIPFTYFAGLWGTEWRLLDDMTYFESGYDMLMLGYGPLELLFTEGGRETAMSFAYSRHTLYYVWNVMAQSLFGTHYFSAVYCNLMVVYATGFVLAQTLQTVGFRRSYVAGAIILHSLHWDYLSWTSLINMRESLVELMIWVVLFSILSFWQRRQLRWLLMAGWMSLMLTSIRLYIPFLLLSATCVWLLIGSSGNQKIVLLLLGLMAAYYFRSYVLGYRDELVPHLFLMGTLRFLLTPQPWSIMPEYSFLLIPSMLQWLLIIPAILGGLWLWQTCYESRLFLLVLLVSVAAYGVTPEAQGPRHRVQLAAFFAWMIFHFLWQFFVNRPARAEEEHQGGRTCFEVKPGLRGLPAYSTAA